MNGWIYTQLGMGEKAASWLKDRFEESELYSMFRNFESLIKAKFLFAEERFEDTISFLNLKENKNGLGSFLLGMLDMNCLEAAAWFRQGDEKTALALLETTYEAASPNSLCMPFIELGHDMRQLAAAAINAGSKIPQQYLEELRSRASAYGKNLFVIAEKLREREEPGAKCYLTRQERAVLNGLSRGQNREEIAASTGQSLGTVKNAISRACEKLGAVNSADAVRIAVTMDLLG
jgi:LuxR family maltose regulon positive regulatory protein